jgi:2-dehydro-3-deoxygluconokinase
LTHQASRVVCLGEALVVMRPDHPAGLSASSRLHCSVGGAEANVATGLAALGVPTAWVSRLGADPFGDLVASDLHARGVRVVADRDAHRPTGAYVKEAGVSGSRMHYYRAGSAATVMDGSLLEETAVARELAACELVHTTGITAGILARGSDLVARLVAARDRRGFVLSVDLNWRPVLWQGRELDGLRELLRAADVLLMGADESEAVLGTADPDRLRGQVGPRPRLVVKSDAHAAVEVAPDGSVTEVPALHVEVVEPVGAGDGFAAGYLAGLVEGRSAAARLRLGHLMAASVLAEPGDQALHPPPSDVRRRLLLASEEAWRATRVSSAGFTAPGSDRSGGEDEPEPEPGAADPRRAGA